MDICSLHQTCWIYVPPRRDCINGAAKLQKWPTNSSAQKMKTTLFPFGMYVVALQVTYSIHTVRVELYESPGDYIRLVLEVILTIWVTIQILSEVWVV